MKVAGVAFVAGLASIQISFANPAITLDFTAFAQSQEALLGSGSGFIPPDTDGAVGPNHIFLNLNGAVTIFDKTGVQVAGFPESQNAFWTAANSGTPVTSAGDMRVVYDPGSGRWFATALSGSSSSTVLLARSDTSDPTGSWQMASFVMTNGRSSDFPTLAVDANGVYIAANEFHGSTFSGVSLVSIPKADVTGSTLNITNRTTLLSSASAATWGTTLQGVFDGAGGGAPGLVLSTVDGSSTLKLMTVTGAGGAGATLGGPTNITIGTPLASPPLALQPQAVPSNIETSDNRFSGEVVRVGNRIYGANETAVGGRDAIEWYVLDNTGNLLSNGLFSDPNFDYYYPSIAANANGDVVIGYNRSGATENISAYAVAGSTSGNTVTFGTPMLIVQSTIGNYFQDYGTGRNRWGDYSATWVDPDNPNVFWTIQEWARFHNFQADGFSGVNNNEWVIQVAQITFQPVTVPEPSTLTLAALAGLGLLWRRRRRA